MEKDHKSTTMCSKLYEVLVCRMLSVERNFRYIHITHFSFPHLLVAFDFCFFALIRDGNIEKKSTGGHKLFAIHLMASNWTMEANIFGTL